MTVESSDNRNDYAPDGIITEFSYEFRVDDADYLVVYEDGVVVTSGYTVSGIGDESGGAVTFDTAPLASVETLTLIREVPLTQGTSYPTFGAFPSEATEQGFDKLTFIAQQLQEQFNRTGLAPVDADPSTDYTLPNYAAGEFWLWDTVEEKIVTSELYGAGLVRQATDSEVSAGSDSSDAFVNPLQLKNYSTTAVATIADLRAITYLPKLAQVVQVLGNTTTDDKGGGTFYWDATSTESESWSCIKVSSIATGRFKKLNITSIKVNDFGPLGNTSGDSTTIQACFDYVNTLDNELPVEVVFPGYGLICYIDSTISSNKDNITVRAHGAGFYPMSDITMFDMNSDASPDDSAEIVRSGYWFGGFFDHGEGGTSTGTALKWNNSRAITINDVRFRGIKHCIEAAFLDSFRVNNLYSRNCLKGFYYPEYNLTDAFVGQDSWLRNWIFSNSSLYDIVCYDFTSGGADILIDGFSANFTNGKVFYARTDLLPLINVRIKNGASEQATSQTLIKIDANSTTENCSGLSVKDCTFSGPLSTAIDVDRIDGLVTIKDNDFNTTNMTAISIGSLREAALLDLDGNRFGQTDAAGGVCWDVSFAGTNSRMKVGDNLYSDDVADRIVSSNSSIAYVADKWETLASDTALDVQPDTGYCQITGTNTISDISDTWRGHRLVLYFTDAASVSDSVNIALAGALVAAADTTLTLVNTGSKWAEVSRSVN
jgi:hypothetical protein